MTMTVSHVSKPKIGESVNGDAVVVRDEGDVVLLAVIDGLGHGPIAAEAAQVAVATLATQSLKEPMIDVVKTLHDKLRGTRGVAATLCLVRGQDLEACAVGNVQVTSSNASIPLVLSAGVLGMRVAKFHVCRGSTSTPSRFGPVSWQRWIETFCLPVRGLRTIMMPAAI